MLLTQGRGNRGDFKLRLHQSDFSIYYERIINHFDGLKACNLWIINNINNKKLDLIKLIGKEKSFVRTKN